jgi:hypothetical protein
MSIINEALKKARDRKTIKPETGTTAPGTLSEKSYRKPPLLKNAEDNNLKIKKTIKNKKVMFYPLIYITGILALILLGIIIFKNSTANNYSGETANIEILTPSQYTETDTSEFLLTGIIHGEGAPMAIINGSVYMTGDTIGSARVSKITENVVIMEDGGKELELRVK